MKAFLSSHLTVPFKTAVVAYFFSAGFYYLSGDYFDWTNNAVLFVAFFLFYIICSVVASMLSFNKNKHSPYVLESTVCDSVYELTRSYHLLKEREGVFHSDYDFKEGQLPELYYTLITDHLEFYNRLKAAEKILNVVGTLKSERALDHIQKYTKELDKMISGVIMRSDKLSAKIVTQRY